MISIWGWRKRGSHGLNYELRLQTEKYINMAFIYSWVPAYKEIVTKLQDYGDRQIELIDLLRNAGVNIHNHEEIRDIKSPLDEIDPFTFLFFLGKARNSDNWVQILRTENRKSQPHVNWSWLFNANK